MRPPRLRRAASEGILPPNARRSRERRGGTGGDAGRLARKQGGRGRQARFAEAKWDPKGGMFFWKL